MSLPLSLSNPPQWMISIAFSVLAITPLKAAHGATQSWDAENQKLRHNFSDKLMNEQIERLWSDDGSALYAKIRDRKGIDTWFSFDLRTGKQTALAEKPDGKPSLDKLLSVAKPIQVRNSKSPDGAWSVTIKDGTPVLSPSDGKSLSQDFPLKKEQHWESGFLWAPNSSAVVLMYNTAHLPRKVHYVRSSPEDRLQPEHFTINYPKPGDALNIPSPVIFFPDGRPPLALDPLLVPDPFEIRNLRWELDSKSLTVEYIERGFGKFRLIEVRPDERKQRVLLAEESGKFTFVYGNTYCNQLSNGKEILWLSQRTGFNQLYLINRENGEVIRPLNTGNTIVRNVTHVDEKARTVLLAVSGSHPGQDPYFLHYIRVDLDTGISTELTDGDGTHQLDFSPDLSHYVDSWSRVNQPPTYEIRRSSDGKKIITLPTADLTALKLTGWQAPEPFTTKDRNGKFDIHGVIFRPSHFDPNKKYPVVENIYAGPHDSFVPKSWSIWHGHKSEMTEAGFIVVQIDGIGTNNRGKEFHEVCYKNLIDSGLPDRIKWIQAAAAKYPQMDITRVGIYGGSAGGQSALAAVLTHPEFYKAAAADCGCHDNRMDKIWWNEQWMDWPVDESYAANSNLTHIAKLEGALMLTVGEVDSNVDPSSTLQVVDALIKADKDFEFYLVPNGNHGIGEIPHLRRKRIEFFQRHLQVPDGISQ